MQLVFCVPIRKFLGLLLLCFAFTQASAQIKAEFSATPISGCAPLIVQFKDESTGNPTEWTWDLGNGVISPFRNPSTTYYNPGSYTIKLRVKNASGEGFTEKLQYITVYAKPIVNFLSSATSGCYPFKVTFTDDSQAGSGTITKWRWDFGDGNIKEGTDNIVEHTYLVPGDYNLALQVTNSFGCVNYTVKEKYIKIADGIRPGFRVSAPSSCALPVSYTFTNESTGTGALTYEWDFDDGSKSTDINPTHTFTVARDYHIKLTVRNDKGCETTITQKHTVGIANTTFTIPAITCVGEPINIRNTSVPTPVSSSWTFGDGTSANSIHPTKVYNTPGIYTIKLVNNFGSCQSEAEQTIEVINRSTVSFIADKINSCRVPFSVQFTSNAQDAIEYEWHFGDGTTSTDANPLHTYSIEDTFDVHLIITNRAGCKESFTLKDYIKIKTPVVKILNLPVEGCKPLTFTPSLFIETVDPIIDYQWNFGDGNTASGKTPTHVYNNVGKYDVTLTYTTQGGCTKTISIKEGIKVGDKPVVNMTVSKTLFCAEETVQFTDLSTATPDTDRWLWSFGDGGTSTAQHPSYSYSDTGYFNVTLTVWSNGCSNTRTINRMVRVKPPVAIFAVTSVCTSNPYYRKFEDASIGAVTYEWRFGDGNTSTEQSPEHTYTRKGTYNVSLTVTNGACSYTTSRTVIIIDDKLELNINKSIICRSSDATFELTGVSDPAHIKQYLWKPSFLAPFEGTDKFTNTFNIKGNYKVDLDVLNINNCLTTLSRTVKVVAPAADIIVPKPEICINNSVTFNNNATPYEAAYPITKWEVWYGDNQTEIVTPPIFNHTYNNGGTYNVKYKVTDIMGCSDSITKNSLIIIGDPKANFSSPDLLSCTTKDIYFNNNSTGTGLTYLWTFGDGQTSTSTNPVHTYAGEGEFTIKLDVKDQYGCTASKEEKDYIKVYNPIAKININARTSDCPPFDAILKNESKNFISHEWDFGDGTKATLPDPNHTYSFPGTYKIILTVNSHGGCKATAEETITIQGPRGTFKYDEIDGCVSHTIKLEGSSATTTSYTWDMGNGYKEETKTGAFNYTYTTPGEYRPVMTLLDKGCSVSYPGNYLVKVYGAKTDITPDKLVLCDNGNITFTENTISNDLIKTYAWDFGDGKNSSAKTPTHTFNGPDNFKVKLKVTTEHGCIAENTVDVKAVLSPKAKIEGDLAACVPALLNFKGLLNNADTSTSFKWEWDFNNGSKSTDKNPASVTYIKDGLYNVALKLTNSSGCIDEANFPITIHPLPNVSVGPEFTLCVGQPKLLTASGATTYSWSNPASLSCNDCATPMANPSTDTKYTVTGKSAFGCEASADINVKVQQRFSVSVNQDTSLCLGGKYRLQASGADGYTWTGNGLDNSTSFQPVATPTTPGLHVYTVKGKDKNGCFEETGKVEIMVHPIPKVELGPDQTLAVGYSMQLKPTISSDVTNIKWTPATGLSCNTCPDPTASPKQNTTYRIDVTNAGGCRSQDLMNIFMTCKGENMYLPNTFSPNSDANNDFFYPRGRGLAYVKSFRIFNRWGEVVFESSNFQVNDKSKGWNGMFKGKPASLDVYIYTIDVVCDNNEILNFKGDVTLLR